MRFLLVALLPVTACLPNEAAVIDHQAALEAGAVGDRTVDEVHRGDLVISAYGDGTCAAQVEGSSDVMYPVRLVATGPSEFLLRSEAEDDSRVVHCLIYEVSIRCLGHRVGLDIDPDSDAELDGAGPSRALLTAEELGLLTCE